jgi:hydrogenase assembly chaperone HypC/HupF
VVGQYLLIHAGYAIQVLDEQEAQQTLELIQQVYFPVDGHGDG